MYERHIGNDHSEQLKGSLHSLFKEKISTKLQSKILQMSTIFHILKLGRPMKDYIHYKDLLNLFWIPKFPSSHWFINSGWEFVKHMDKVVRQYLREIIKKIIYFPYH